MNKTLKIVAMVVGGLVLLVVLGVAYVVATFDANRVKAEISRVVMEKQQRTLNIEGELSLTFFPNVGVRLGKTTLSERGSARTFAALDSARVSVAVMPLLAKRLVVDTVELSGVRASLLQRADGTLNIDDFLAKDKPAAPAATAAPSAVSFDVNGIRLTDAQLDWRDLKSGQAATVSKLNLSVGRIANAATGKIELSAHLSANQPKSDADLKLTGAYDFDLEQQRYALAKLDAAVKGALAGIQGLDLQLQANSIEALPAKQSVAATGLALATRGSQGETSFDLKLKLPKLDMAAPTPGAGAILNTSLSADLTLANPQMPMKTLSVPITGSVRADLGRQSADIALDTRFDESKIAAKLNIEKFSPLALGFAIDIDKLNVDKYLPPEKKKKSEASDGRIDLSALKGLNVHGTLNIGALQVAKVKAANIHLEVRGEGGRLSIAPLSADLYQGKAAGSLSVDANGNAVAFKQALTNISIDPLLVDAANTDLIEGRGNVAVDVSTRGDTVSAMKRQLAGTASIRLGDGAIKGINVAQRLRELKGKLSGGDVAQAASSADKTDFTELSASFKINRGVAHNDDLAMKSPFLRLGGTGDIDVGAGSIDYLAKASVVTTAGGQGGKDLEQLKGLTVPLRVSGPFDKLSFKLELAALANSAVKAKVEEKKQEVREKLQDTVKDKLKGLLSR